MNTPDSKERLVIVETRITHLEDVQKAAAEELKDMERSSAQSFAEIKESTVNLRVSVEVMAKTMQQQGSKLAELEGELGEFKKSLNSVEDQVIELRHGMTISKVRALGYIGGIAFALSVGWAIVGDTVTSFTKHVVTAAVTQSADESR